MEEGQGTIRQFILVARIADDFESDSEVAYPRPLGDWITTSHSTGSCNGDGHQSMAFESSQALKGEVLLQWRAPAVPDRADGQAVKIIFWLVVHCSF